jgi:hypothetical protein
MEPVTILSIVASVVTTVSGIGWVLERNGKRIDDRFGTIIRHMEKMERVLDNLRTDLPIKYTLREDHLRLTEKVEDIQKELIIWKTTES